MIVLTVAVGDAQRVIQCTLYCSYACLRACIGGVWSRTGMFLSFFNNFNKAAHAPPLSDVIMIGMAIADLYPDMLIGLVAP